MHNPFPKNDMLIATVTMYIVIAKESFSLADTNFIVICLQFQI